jgi:hypothetical protein
MAQQQQNKIRLGSAQHEAHTTKRKRRDITRFDSRRHKGRRGSGNRRSVWTIGGEDSKEGIVPSVLGG